MEGDAGPDNAKDYSWRRWAAFQNSCPDQAFIFQIYHNSGPASAIIQNFYFIDVPELTGK